MSTEGRDRDPSQVQPRSLPGRRALTARRVATPPGCHRDPSHASEYLPVGVVVTTRGMDRDPSHGWEVSIPGAVVAARGRGRDPSHGWEVSIPGVVVAARGMDRDASHAQGLPLPRRTAITPPGKDDCAWEWSWLPVGEVATPPRCKSNPSREGSRPSLRWERSQGSFTRHSGLSSAQGIARSICLASASTSPSARGRPAICTPMGWPSWSGPQGRSPPAGRSR